MTVSGAPGQVVIETGLLAQCLPADLVDAGRYGARVPEKRGGLFRCARFSQAVQQPGHRGRVIEGGVGGRAGRENGDLSAAYAFRSSRGRITCQRTVRRPKPPSYSSGALES
jgi:hypothetical protein